jgi:hypothetical protein
MSSMNKCFKPEFTNLEWEYDETKFAALVRRENRVACSGRRHATGET